MDRYIDENLLTTEVTNRPAIWDSLSVEYNNMETRRRAWDEVVQIFALPGDNANIKLLLGRKIRTTWVKIRNRLIWALRDRLLSDIDVLHRLACFKQGETFRNRLTVKSLNYFINAITRDLELSEAQEAQRNAQPTSTIRRPRGGFASLNVASTPLADDPLNDPVNEPLPRATPRFNFRDHLSINEIIDNAIAEEEEVDREFWIDDRGDGFNNIERDFIRTNVRDYFNTNGISRQEIFLDEANAAEQQASTRTLQRLRDCYNRLLDQLNEQQRESRPLTGRQVWNNLRQPYAPNDRQDMRYNSLRDIGRQSARNPFASPRTYTSPFVQRTLPHNDRANDVIRIPPARGVPRILSNPASDPIPNSNRSNVTRSFTVISGNSPRVNNVPPTNGQLNNYNYN